MIQFLFRDGQWRQWPDAGWYELDGSRLVPYDRGPFDISKPYIYSNDGCSKSPDFFRGKDIWPACVIHDRDYFNIRAWQDGFHSSWSEIARKEADDRFYRNIKTVLKQQGENPVIAWILAQLYWRIVRESREVSIMVDETDVADI